MIRFFKKHRGYEDYKKSDTIIKCDKCKAEMAEKEMANVGFICPVCGKYNRVPARVRIDMITDKGSFKELWKKVTADDPLDFPDYKGKYESAAEESSEYEGVICGTAKIDGHKTCIFAMEPKFMMGSMGTVVGDKITRLFEYAVEHELPVVGYSVSGGARMQEGMLSLIQMEKVSAAVKKHSDAGLFYMVCAADPTTGGVTASFAMLGDVIISEPGARIGFAGKRVVEQVTGEKMPDNFQSAEFQLQNGFLDDIVPRDKHREYFSRMLAIHERRQ